MPEDFGSTKSLENAGILDVFQVFQTALLGRKIGHPGEKEFLEVPFSLSAGGAGGQRALHAAIVVIALRRPVRNTGANFSL